MIAIIGAMEEEVALLKGQLSNLKETQVAHTRFYHGTLANKEVVLLQSGIGKVNVAISTALLIHMFNPDYVINTGSAGGLQSGLNLGDVVVSTHVSYHDADARAFGYEMGQIPGMPSQYQADETLIQAVHRVLQSLNQNAMDGLIVSGDSFIGTDQQRTAILEYFPHAIAAEMEAAAVAQTCFQFDKPFIVTRAISDLADAQASMTFDEFLKVASKSSSEMVYELVKEL
ncbi:5'-methylthioadenosine/S-adenosylhomocysteine nucleosidase [Staphylococcus sp. 17KM0847]|uniref:5'-methylthioadenosine/S-adenosylhomocysteine nucleosidase n=1 Tax=Staphylococcus sp. 17KM0847 TaxID=2583989 RepID=UPI0015DC11DB|nr:5'-methylthioadenosine/S-adenosylhomocysteine nucleosidase [Staphylococcus sp. 17KM0847]QLK86022.1 5'-methylthioadenosine/S-adenosylhomocysteine nucleosidase [Staphylococcus sp. 17KM0847]